MNIATIKQYLTQVYQQAQTVSQLTYISVALGVLVGLVLFRTFFWNLAGFIHCIGFSLGASPNSAEAAKPGVARKSRIKLLLGTVLPPGTGYAAYVFLPRWFPTLFQ